MNVSMNSMPRKDNKMTNEELIEVLHNKIQLLATTQMSLLDYCTSPDRLQGNNPSELMNTIMLATLSNKEMREDFTQYINEHGDDESKLNMMDINEELNPIKNFINRDINEEK